MKVTFKNKGLELMGVDDFASIYVLCNFAHVFFRHGQENFLSMGRYMKNFYFNSSTSEVA
ncbi:hypothetical protein XBJ1_2834 [Xenorhabdus bovienii SS-2004]|uniref:Uncharacterized protein n=1 Tax=Xenorhabdus bovienii (strain SS-2004) TaxID=406818 RepID=D3V7Z6_XENBS|nr:hypothetical protein XBJ1_2834 [Xenorhabdus bovienii SS-2004]